MSLRVHKQRHDIKDRRGGQGAACLPCIIGASECISSSAARSIAPGRVLSGGPPERQLSLCGARRATGWIVESKEGPERDGRAETQ
ncbi:unnamed protein product [Lampetra planeri]